MSIFLEREFCTAIPESPDRSGSAERSAHVRRRRDGLIVETRGDLQSHEQRYHIEFAKDGLEREVPKVNIELDEKSASARRRMSEWR